MRFIHAIARFSSNTFERMEFSLTLPPALCLGIKKIRVSSVFNLWLKICWPGANPKFDFSSVSICVHLW